MSADKRHFGLNRIYVCGSGPSFKPGSTTANSLMARLIFSETIYELFPYINAVAKHSYLYTNPPLLRFLFKQRQCVLYPNHCIVTPFDGRSQVSRFAEDFVVFINDIANRKASILPKSKTFRRISVIDIIKLLPLKNCGDCGFKTCMAFAAAISQQRVTPGVCPYFSQPLAERAAYPVYDSNGKLMRTVLLDIDTTKINEELRNTRRNSRGMDAPIGDLDEQRETAGDKAGEVLPAPLTRRELEVLQNIARGETNNEIGKRLHISPHTVKSHVTSIFNKLGVNDRIQASVWAVRQNLL